MYFAVINGQSKGPYTLLELKQMLDRGEVEPLTLVHERHSPDQWAERRFLRVVLEEHLPPQPEDGLKASTLTDSQTPEPKSDALKLPPPLPRKVGGWLLFFCIGLAILSPLFSAANIVVQFSKTNHLFSAYPSLQTGMVTEAGVRLCILVFGIYVGWEIWSGSPAGRNLARRYLKFRLIMVLIGSVLSLLIYHNLPPTIFVFGKAFTSALATGIAEACYFLIWSAYFNRSKRIAATYGQEDADISPAFSHAISRAAPVQTAPDKLTAVNDESLYEQAMKEAQTGTARPGLWAKAFSTAQGEESKTKALYIQYRVEQLQGEREATTAILEQAQVKNAVGHQVEGEGKLPFLGESRERRSLFITRLVPIIFKAMFIVPPVAGVFGFFGGLHPLYSEGRAGLIFQDGIGAGLGLFGVTLLLLFFLWLICSIAAQQFLRMNNRRK